MAEYRARLENYVLLPNIKDKIFVGKYFLKKLVRNLDGCHQIERFHVGNDFVFETIQGYVLILRSWPIGFFNDLLTIIFWKASD